MEKDQNAQLEQLKGLLGEKVKFYIGDNQTAIGEVVGIYKDHKCQSNNLKIFYTQENGKEIKIYKRLDDVTKVEPPKKLYAYSDSQGFIIFKDSYMTDQDAVNFRNITVTRKPEFDMEFLQ